MAVALEAVKVTTAVTIPAKATVKVNSATLPQAAVMAVAPAVVAAKYRRWRRQWWGQRFSYHQVAHRRSLPATLK